MSLIISVRFPRIFHKGNTRADFSFFSFLFFFFLFQNQIERIERIRRRGSVTSDKYLSPAVGFISGKYLVVFTAPGATNREYTGESGQSKRGTRISLCVLPINGLDRANNLLLAQRARRDLHKAGVFARESIAISSTIFALACSALLRMYYNAYARIRCDNAIMLSLKVEGEGEEYKHLNLDRSFIFLEMNGCTID